MFSVGKLPNGGKNRLMNVARQYRIDQAIDTVELEPEVAALLRHVPQQERSVQRVNVILAMADALFAAAGYDTVTTNQIAAQADLPIGSLYQFFADKTTILQALAARYRSGLAQLLAANPAVGGTIGEAVNQFLDLLFIFGHERWGFTRILLLGSASPETKPAIADVQTDMVHHLAQVITPYLMHLRAEEREEAATIAMTAFQALLAHAVALKYTLDADAGRAAMERAFVQTKLMIGAYIERLTTLPSICNAQMV